MLIMIFVTTAFFSKYVYIVIYMSELTPCDKRNELYKFGEKDDENSNKTCISIIET